MKTLLLTPPLMQLNTPYPATPYLTAYLRSLEHSVDQRDLGLDFALKIFTKESLEIIFNQAKGQKLSQRSKILAQQKDRYLECIDPVIYYLQSGQGLNEAIVAARSFLPEGPRFKVIDEHPARHKAIMSLAVKDRCKYLCTLFLFDIVDWIHTNVDENFEFSKYGEKLAESATSFNPLYKRLKSKNTILDDLLFACVKKYNVDLQPDVVGFTAPFPGNLYGALKAAQFFKRLNPNIKIILGGGYINTELRNLEDARLFEFIDYLVFDDGQKPLELILNHLSGKILESDLLRTWTARQGQIIQFNSKMHHDVPFKKTPGPTYVGLSLNKYLSLIDMPNVMARMWSEERWNKIVLAHGCYWKKCTFCDISLDYIERFEPMAAAKIVDEMVRIFNETGFDGFHFVDEAAPPALLKQISQIIIERRLKFRWWGNIRFDHQFTAETAMLMAQAGCIAVTGGIEVASPRVLKLINKGVTLPELFDVTRNFKQSGIYVHAYLMYGYPTQTTQETMNSLEVVRKLFAGGHLNSAYWHEFVATAHSPVGKNPERFNIKLLPNKKPKEGLFALNSIAHQDPTGTPHTRLSLGLKRAVYNYMHQVGLDADVREWFDFRVPRPNV
jgi:radical SAM superfamily enzyme YgiQ (UPF0313 family)